MKIAWLLLLYLNAHLLFSQSESIKMIRNYYNDISSQIKVCEGNSEDCMLYLNKYSINANDQPWRAVGNYERYIEFWYDDDPSVCDECGEKGIHTLKKIVVNAIASSSSTYEEFLFLKGELVFYYQRDEDEYGSIEDRFYFESGQLIRLQQQDELLDVGGVESTMIQRIKNQSQTLKNVYLGGF